MRRLNPILVINGIFLIVMMLLFARFVNTGTLFQEPSAIEKLKRHLAGAFMTADSSYHLQVTEVPAMAGREPKDQTQFTLQFTASPPLPAPWNDSWTFQISRFGPLEILAEVYDGAGQRWNGCELVFHAEDDAFVGKTLGGVCGVDSAGQYLTLSLRTAADSLIFATRQILPNGGADFSRELLFLRQPTQTN